MFLHNTLVDRVEGADSSSVCVYSVPLVGLGGGGPQGIRWGGGFDLRINRKLNFFFFFSHFIFTQCENVNICVKLNIFAPHVSFLLRGATVTQHILPLVTQGGLFRGDTDLIKMVDLRS